MSRPVTATEIAQFELEQKAANEARNAHFDAMMDLVWAPLLERAKELATMYGIVDPNVGIDPLTQPLPPIAKSADWDAKDRQVQWVRANFTPGMLAKLYKLSYDVDGVRRAECDALIRKG